MNFRLRHILVCALCILPGYFVIAFFWVNVISALPLFFGGMFYGNYLNEVNDKE